MHPSTNNTIELEENPLGDINDVLEDDLANIEINIVEEIENCVIVVGVFKEESNLKNTLITLEKNGYSPVQGLINKTMHYAGVPIQCNEEKTARMNALNTIFNIESWVFRK